MNRLKDQLGTASRALPAALLLCLALRSAPAAAPQFSSDAAGTAGAQFLKMAVGARPAALGEAYAAVADDAFALDWNPAGLINIAETSLALMHSPYLAGSNLDFFAYAENAGEVGAWGLAAKRMAYGKIKRTDSAGQETGSFEPTDTAFSVGLACYISSFNKDPEERFVLGATGKIVRSNIVSSDNTLSADVGILTPLYFDGSFRMGLAAQNVMGSLRFDKDETPLPLLLRFGTMTRFGRHAMLTADLVGAKDHLPFLAAGAEVRISPSKTSDIFLRGGFNTRAVGDLTGLRDVALGAGTRFGDYTVDYAFSPFGDLGAVHRLSVTVSFRRPRSERD